LAHALKEDWGEEKKIRLVRQKGNEGKKKTTSIHRTSQDNPQHGGSALCPRGKRKKVWLDRQLTSSPENEDRNKYKKYQNNAKGEEKELPEIPKPLAGKKKGFRIVSKTKKFESEKGLGALRGRGRIDRER